VVLSVFEQDLAEGLDEQGRERVLVLTAFAIGRIGTEKLTDYLPKLIEDKSQQVRLATAQAVLQITKK
jgi:HEAT repeat protein